MRRNGLFISFILMLFCIMTNCANVYATEQVMYSEPKVIVTSYEIVEGTVSNGEEFTIKIHLMNMNQYSSAYNVITYINSINNNIVILDKKSNLLYFDVIEAGATAEATIKMKMLETGNNSLSVLSVFTTYYNELGKQYSIESDITLTVEERVQLEVAAITVSENAVVGANALVSVRYVNAGDTKLNNISMILDGKIEDSQRVIKLGDLDAGMQKYKDCYVAFTEDGEQELNISFEYQDKYGNAHHVNAYECTLTVYPYTMTEEIDYVIDMGEFKLKKKEAYMLAIGCIVFLLLIITSLMGVIIRGSKKNRK